MVSKCTVPVPLPKILSMLCMENSLWAYLSYIEYYYPGSVLISKNILQLPLRQ